MTTRSRIGLKIWQIEQSFLKKKTRTDAYRRNLKGAGGSKFGERIGEGKHEHEWGRTVENEEGMTVKTCTECGMEVEELEF